MTRVASLSDTHPEIAKQWHPTLNEGLQPTDVSSGMGARVWWQCSRGHEWQTAIGDRKKHGCPYCSGNKVLAGFNDIATTHPHLSEQWHPTKNGSTQPNEYSAGSNYKKWWLCSNSHAWYTQISHRTQGKGCPTCAGRKIVQGFNDLAGTHPQLAAEWHPSLNTIPLRSVTRQMNVEAWWQCDGGHEWQENLHIRIHSHSSCPMCALDTWGTEVFTN